MRVTFDHVDNIAENIRMFWFRADRKPRHIAGQFIELRLPHEPKDKRGERRWFTLSSSPTEDLLAITTKFASENGSSFKVALSGLEPGAEVDMAEPMGDFILPKDPSTPLLFVAGGIGVTPMRSMIKFLTDSGESRPITLLYAANSPGELAFTDLFESAPITFIPVVSNDADAWTGQTGTLDAQRILDLGKPTDDTLIYLSGPEPMIESLESGLKDLGVNKKRLKTDFFPGYTSF